MSEFFYHIHNTNYKDDIWKEGNELYIENENNPFWNYSLNYTISSDNDINNILKEYQMLIRELGMEEIRKKVFPQLPSRQKCIWLCRKEQIGYWNPKISDKTEIFKVEIFDRPFKTRDSLIPLPCDSYSEILKKSKEYWLGTDNTLNEDDEYLYVGKVKIIDKIKETNN